MLRSSLSIPPSTRRNLGSARGWVVIGRMEWVDRWNSSATLTSPPFCLAVVVLRGSACQVAMSIIDVHPDQRLCQGSKAPRDEEIRGVNKLRL